MTGQPSSTDASSTPTEAALKLRDFVQTGDRRGDETSPDSSSPPCAERSTAPSCTTAQRRKPAHRPRTPRGRDFIDEYRRTTADDRPATSAATASTRPWPASSARRPTTDSTFIPFLVDVMKGKLPASSPTTGSPRPKSSSAAGFDDTTAAPAGPLRPPRPATPTTPPTTATATALAPSRPPPTPPPTAPPTSTRRPPRGSASPSLSDVDTKDSDADTKNTVADTDTEDTTDETPATDANPSLSEIDTENTYPSPPSPMSIQENSMDHSSYDLDTENYDVDTEKLR